jgi:hypothetical protein
MALWARERHDINYLGIRFIEFERWRRWSSIAWSPCSLDLSAGMFAAIGILGQARHKTGEGQFIDVSMTDGLLSWMGTYLPEHGHLEVS